MKQDSRILITGANGLAGSAVLDHLLDRGFTNVFGLTRKDADLVDDRQTANAFSDVRAEYVFHAAATVYGLQGNMDNQAKSIYENTLINSNVIHASHLTGAKKIVVMGTNAIYPATAPLPYREQDIFNGRPHEGEAAYGNAKRHMLAMLEAYHESYGTNYAYLVSGNLYGPRDRFNVNTGHVLPSLVAKFHSAAVDPDPDTLVSIWGDGSAQRDFLYSADLARIVKLTFERDIVGAFNIGNGKLHSICEVAQHLAEISGISRDRVLFDITKPTGRRVCYADLSVLEGYGFSPEYSLEQGLRETYAWYAAQKA